MLNTLKKIVRWFVDKALSFMEPRINNLNKNSSQVKIQQRLLSHFYQQLSRQGCRIPLSETGFRVYSQFEEDGLLLYIFSVIGVEHQTFVDIGSGDGINSNCANFAVNFGWHGLFIDGNAENIKKGKAYYSGNPDTFLYPPVFTQALVRRENINEIISDSGFATRIDLLSIDIDGNDYWVWEAINVIDPRVVIIETHVEFGKNSIVVPYDPNYSYPGKHPDYHGASPVAMEKLARRKGYRLVGANKYGFNTIYVKKGLGEEVLPAVTVESILSHPRNKERFQLFEPIKGWDYLEV